MRRDEQRKAEFELLIKEKQAPALRNWMIWMNSVYRYNCTLAGQKP